MLSSVTIYGDTHQVSDATPVEINPLIVYSDGGEVVMTLKPTSKPGRKSLPFDLTDVPPRDGGGCSGCSKAARLLRRKVRRAERRAERAKKRGSAMQGSDTVLPK